jgi:hypothetical protein
MSQRMLLTAATARRIITHCTQHHDPFPRICLVRVHDPGAVQHDRKVCGPCKHAATVAQQR